VKNDPSQPLTVFGSHDETTVWKQWRAPRLIHMRPAGNTLFDAATMWHLEDEPRSAELLHNRSQRFIQFLEMHLDKVVGAAYVQFAQRQTPQAASRPGPETTSGLYPQEFAADARAHVEIAIVKAGMELSKRRQEVQSRDNEDALRKYILRVFLVFVDQACSLGMRQEWTVDRIRSEANEFLRMFTIRAYYESGFDGRGRVLPRMTSPLNGSILPEVQREYEKAPEWQEYQEKLLAVAESHIQPVQNSRTSELGFWTPQGMRNKEAGNSLAGDRQEKERPVLSYRSELKRAILIQITKNPKASDLEICRGMDADGAAELPPAWKFKGTNRLFVAAYMDPTVRHKIEIAISRVRSDLRKHGVILDR
jgi:hypothetical protein